ncbi:4-amino-4-deoxychorismate lyase [Chitinivorax tropicus]|uniref:aminodeoxychorismate lyase n=1 Tax=Chitinivorax tropicus TaxID=714531 RepID=A0A840MGY0_9PROT|nr:aminodeoxychorismate lyase [Chitinivorax tropicus]MBB5017650.1 4-amino-4-deoxychorismate lyase [Chitinivorax tropicus]
MILVNGRPLETVAANDRGLAYGDGVFRTLPIRDGMIAGWAWHLALLARDCQTLHLPMPTLDLLADEMRQCIAGIETGVAKITVTRGEGPRGYRIDPACAPTRILQATAGWPYQDAQLQQGIRLIRCRTQVTVQPALAGAKTLNRLDSVLARREWQDSQVFDGLMADQTGAWLETTMCSLFVEYQGALWLPDLAHAGVSGLSREVCLTCCRQLSIPVIMGRIDDNILANADAVMVANSLIGLVPVIDVEGQPYGLSARFQQLRAAWDRALAESTALRI